MPLSDPAGHLSTGERLMIVIGSAALLK